LPTPVNRRLGTATVLAAARLTKGHGIAVTASIKTFQEAGLAIGTCVEPIGPEHSNEELAESILFTAEIDPAFSGAARRIPIPGTALAKRGMITELRLAQIVAVTRLVVPRNVTGNCAHEPGTVPIMGGANLLWAEVGANPRDTMEKTEEGRGHSVHAIRKLFTEREWQAQAGSSHFFAKGLYNFLNSTLDCGSRRSR